MALKWHITTSVNLVKRVVIYIICIRIKILFLFYKNVIERNFIVYLQSNQNIFI